MEDLKLDLDNFYIYIYIKTEQKNWKGEIHNSYDHTQCNKLIAPNEKHVQQFYPVNTTNILLLHIFFPRRSINSTTTHICYNFSRIWYKPYGTHYVKSQVDQS